MKKKELFVVISVLFLTIVCFAILILQQNSNSGFVVVTVNGEVYGKYSIYENQEIQISHDDCKNVICIEGKSVYMKTASCPDKLCIKMGHISKNNQVICCLPNRVVVSICSDDETAIIDSSTY